MSKIIFALDSPTKAIKVKNAFIRSSITAKIVKLEDGSAGCTHGVMINEDDMLKAISLLRSNGIKYTVRNENDLS